MHFCGFLGSIVKTFWGKLGVLFVAYYGAIKRISSVFIISAMTQFPRPKARSIIRFSPWIYLARNRFAALTFRVKDI